MVARISNNKLNTAPEHRVRQPAGILALTTRAAESLAGARGELF
jgi:hypothetical protein